MQFLMQACSFYKKNVSVRRFCEVYKVYEAHKAKVLRTSEENHNDQFLNFKFLLAKS